LLRAKLQVRQNKFLGHAKKVATWQFCVVGSAQLPGATRPSLSFSPVLKITSGGKIGWCAGLARSMHYSRQKAIARRAKSWILTGTTTLNVVSGLTDNPGAARLIPADSTRIRAVAASQIAFQRIFLKS
jgi:hypothetical protein